MNKTFCAFTISLGMLFFNSCSESKQEEKSNISQSLKVLEDDKEITTRIEKLLSAYDKGICNVYSQVEQMEHDAHVKSDKEFPVTDPKNMEMVMKLQEEGRNEIMQTYNLVDSNYIAILFLGNSYCN